MLFSSIIFNILGQFSLKYGINNFMFKYEGINISLFFKRFIILGFILYGISAVFWVSALSKINLNVAYPTLAFGYVIVYFISHIVFGEPIYFKGIIGIILILTGILLIHIK